MRGCFKFDHCFDAVKVAAFCNPTSQKRDVGHPRFRQLTTGSVGRKSKTAGMHPTQTEGTFEWSTGREGNSLGGSSRWATRRLYFRCGVEGLSIYIC